MTRKPTGVVSRGLQPTASAPHSLRETTVETSVGMPAGEGMSLSTPCLLSPHQPWAAACAILGCVCSVLARSLQQQSHPLLPSTPPFHLHSLPHTVCTCTEKSGCFAHSQLSPSLLQDLCLGASHPYPGEHAERPSNLTSALMPNRARS